MVLWRLARSSLETNPPRGFLNRALACNHVRFTPESGHFAVRS
jgi:hypothetical protein